MFPVCPLCCFIVISMDPVSEINDDDDDDKRKTAFTTDNFGSWGLGMGLKYQKSQPLRQSASNEGSCIKMDRGILAVR